MIAYELLAQHARTRDTRPLRELEEVKVKVVPALVVVVVGDLQCVDIFAAVLPTFFSCRVFVFKSIIHSKNK